MKILTYCAILTTVLSTYVVADELRRGDAPASSKAAIMDRQKDQAGIDSNSEGRRRSGKKTVIETEKQLEEHMPDVEKHNMPPVKRTKK